MKNPVGAVFGRRCGPEPIEARFYLTPLVLLYMGAPDLRSLTGLHWVGFVLAAITGVIHLWLGVEFIDSPMGWSFLAAGIGYFAAIALVIFDIRRRLVYLLGIPYTAVQIPLWWVVNDIQLADLLDPGIGVFDKLVQVVLIAVLIALYAQAEQ